MASRMLRFDWKLSACIVALATSVGIADKLPTAMDGNVSSADLAGRLLDAAKARWHAEPSASVPAASKAQTPGQVASETSGTGECYTQCPVEETRCPVDLTRCPPETTQCPAVLTECPVEVTFCDVNCTEPAHVEDLVKIEVRSP